MVRRSEPWPAGTPCWTDLMTPDLDASIAFYREALGWEIENQGEAYNNYCLARRDGAVAAGMMPAMEGMPTAWMLYLATEDAEASVAAAKKADATVFQEPFDVDVFGRIAVAADPAGQVFGLWQHGQAIGFEIANEPGSVVWEDLRSNEPAKAREFYAAVFGWTYADVPEMTEDYQLIRHGTPRDDGGEELLGGIGALLGTDPGWLVYFAVEDVDALAAYTTKEGGAVLTPPVDTPYGRMGTFRDPQGARFAGITLPS